MPEAPLLNTLDLAYVVSTAVEEEGDRRAPTLLSKGALKFWQIVCDGHATILIS